MISTAGQYIVFCGSRVVCQSSQSWRPVSGAELIQESWQVVQVLSLAPFETPLQVVSVKKESVTGLQLGLRELLPYVDEAAFRLLGTAYQVLEWARNHRFCGR